MATYTITLTDAEDKGIRYLVDDPQDWIQNAASSQAQRGIDTIYAQEVERMTNDPDITSIPADKDQVVLDAEVLSLAERNEQAENEFHDPPETN